MSKRGIVPVLLSGAAVAALGLTTNLVAWWELDEVSGDRDDVHTNGLTLTDNNTVTSDTGVGGTGTAAVFASGNSETLSRPDNDLLDTGNIDFTIAFWTYGVWANVMGLVTKNDVASNREYEIIYYDAPDRFEFNVTSDGLVGTIATVDANGLGSPADSTWYFVVAQHDSVANTISLQVNDGTRTTTSHSAGVFAGTSNFILGSHVGAANYLTGRMAKVGFWKSAAGAGGVLSAAQLTALYNSGTGLSYAALT
jgi:hypothetical protein